MSTTAAYAVVGGSGLVLGNVVGAFGTAAPLVATASVFAASASASTLDTSTTALPGREHRLHPLSAYQRAVPT